MRNMTFGWTCLVGLFLLANNLLAQTEEVTRSLKPFNGIKVSNGIEATLVKGDKHEISITATAVELDKVETKVTDRILEVAISGSSPRASSVKATITYVDIDQVHANTSAKVFGKERIEARDVKITTATSAYIEAEVKAHDLSLEAQTNSRIFLKGEAENLDFQLFTNSEIDAKGLSVSHVDIRANTNAKGEISVKESVKGSAATRGRVTYYGDPKVIDVKTNTGGDINGN
ncbi:head GIN domain-containing protein [Pleomorphovibrio marinus]|uniref:head GIN domain-containing protein n=1 Tax=Pleomorphovibrio marinus TaxID=2164132 RepID=UPI000E0B3B4A|nr:head GIN domain-containing protein [Pleomorphovibrio marinus]